MGPPDSLLWFCTWTPVPRSTDSALASPKFHLKLRFPDPLTEPYPLLMFHLKLRLTLALNNSPIFADIHFYLVDLVTHTTLDLN